MSFEEAAAGRAALTVYEAVHELTVQAWTDPSQDWASRYAALTDDPYQSEVLDELAAAADRGDAYTGTLGSNPTVTGVDLAEGVITVTDCLDTSDWQLVDATTGQPAAAAGAGTDRHSVDATVHRSEGRWQLFDRTENPDQPC